MNEDELCTMILAHYEGEAQTLTSGTEANLLKFKELVGWMTEENRMRWAEVKKAFNKNKLLKGMSDKDPMVRAVECFCGWD